MISPNLIDILCCPETHQPVKLADASRVAELNARIAAGNLRNRGGQLVTEPIEAGLVRADLAYLYPVRRDIPIMLIDEALPLS